HVVLWRARQDGHHTHHRSLQAVGAIARQYTEIYIGEPTRSVTGRARDCLDDPPRRSNKIIGRTLLAFDKDVLVLGKDDDIAHGKCRAVTLADYCNFAIIHDQYVDGLRSFTIYGFVTALVDYFYC